MTSNEHADVIIAESCIGHEVIAVGEARRLSAPFDNVILDAQQDLHGRRRLLIAGGVGITPMTGRLAASAQAGRAGSVMLLASFRTGEEILFRDETHGVPT